MLMPYTNPDHPRTLNVAELNPLRPTQFTLAIDTLKYPAAEFNVQSVTLPDVSASSAELAHSQVMGNMRADKLTYSDLEVTFLIDEKLINYTEMHDWIHDTVTAPDTDNIARDITLLVLDSNNNTTREIKFVSAIPVSLGSVAFNAAVSDMEFLVGTVSFNYAYFKIL